MPVDLGAYFERIGYSGARTPTLETLKALHFAHALSIPFENLSVLAKRPVSLDLTALQQKLVGARRGGYCFEVNGLFAAVMRQLGFNVTTLISRVRWKTPDDVDTGPSHMLSLIDLPEGRFLADIGFGGLTMTGPIRLETDIEQQTPHEPRRLLADGDGYMLQAKLGEEWGDVYRFTLDPQTRADYEIANWYTSTHPQSIFAQFLIVARPLADRRITLFNCNLTIRHLDGRVENRRLESSEEIAAALAEHFDLPLSDEDRAVVLDPHMDAWRAMATA